MQCICLLQLKAKRAIAIAGSIRTKLGLNRAKVYGLSLLRVRASTHLSQTVPVVQYHSKLNHATDLLQEIREFDHARTLCLFNF